MTTAETRSVDRGAEERAGAALAVVPLVLLGVVVACDSVLDRGWHGVPLTAALDWPAHVATAALLLLAGLGRTALRWPLLVVALAAAVAIDLDHLALYTGHTWVSAGGRPFTHSPALVLAVGLLAGGAALLHRRRAARVLGAVAVGVALHLVRDLGTGPGTALWWPLSWDAVKAPYPGYLAAVVTAAVVAVVRLARPGAPERRRAEPRQRWAGRTAHGPRPGVDPES